MSDFQPGTYQGTVKNAILDQVGENETLMVKVLFNIPELRKTVGWTGWFSEKVNERTGKSYAELVTEQLVALGFSGSSLSEIVEDKDGKLFNQRKEWNLEIDYQKDKNGNTTKYLEVNWINDPDKSYTSKLDKAQAVQKMKGLGLDGILAKAKKDNPQPEFSADDIPF